jgi:hypothetical protein
VALASKEAPGLAAKSLDLRWNQSRLGKENFRWSYDFMPLRREGTAARGWQLLDSGEGRMTVRGLASADRARLQRGGRDSLSAPMGIGSNPLRSTRKSAQTDVIS